MGRDEDELRELRGRLSDDLAGAVSLIERSLDQLGRFDVCLGVQPATAARALRAREPVAPLPHSKHILGQAGFAFDGADVENETR